MMIGTLIWQENEEAKNMFRPFFLRILRPKRSKARNPFFCHIFLAIVIAWQFKCGDFDKLKNATNLLHFNLDFVTFWLRFFSNKRQVV